MPRKSLKRNCRRRYQRRAGAAARLAAQAVPAAPAHGTGPRPSCRTCPPPPSARRPHAASPRYRRWKRRGEARRARARGWSWSGARWTWSASCGPTATPTCRWTSATTSSDPARPAPPRPAPRRPSPHFLANPERPY